jgi:hypothetical protein
VNRWYATENPQHMLPGSAACALGTTRRFDSVEQISKPVPGEAP